MATLGQGDPRDVAKVTSFKGLADYVSYKEIDPTEHLSYVRNANYDSDVGVDKDLGYDNINDSEFNASTSINLIEEIALGSDTYRVFSSGKNLYSLNLTTNLGTLIKECFTDEDAIVSGSEFQGEYYFGNGTDNPKIFDGTVVRDVNAPKATASTVAGNPNGEYYYAITFVLAGGEEYQGTVSNTVTVASKQVTLSLPIGYDGTTSRKLYRTTASGANLYLLDTVADNTTLTYTDNTADGDLGGAIIGSVVAMPLCKYFTVGLNNRLFMSGSSVKPTQVYYSDTDSGVIDPVNGYYDHSGVAEDSSPVANILTMYGSIFTWSHEEIYRTTEDSGTFSTIKTEANVGCKSPYTISLLPAFQDFGGGAMFLASDGHFRLFTGNISLPVATSLDNLKTDSYSAVISGTTGISTAINKTYQDGFYSKYFNFNYNCAVRINGYDKNTFMFRYNIKTQGWAIRDSQDIKCMGEMDSKFYSGRTSTSYIDRQFYGNSFDGDDIPFKIETGAFFAQEGLNHFRKLYMYFNDTSDASLFVDVTYEDLNDQIKTFTVNLKGDALLDVSFTLDVDGLDEEGTPDIYKINLNKHARWLKVTVRDTSQNVIKWRGMALYYDKVWTP